MNSLKMKSKMLCQHCGGENVVLDAWASWDFAKQKWVLRNVLDQAFCGDCKAETKIEKIQTKQS